MSEELLKRLLNVALRSLSLGSRFALLFVLARLLTSAELGLYGLVVVTVSFSVLVLGGDYYTYSHRELMSRPREQWSFVLQHQVLAVALLYVVLLPLQGLVFGFGLLPCSVAIWFFTLLVVEHLAQELNRLLVAMQMPLTASWVLFVRSGLWVWVVVPLMWNISALQNLETIFLAWFVGSLLAVLLGVGAVWRAIPNWQWWRIDWAWLRTGYRKGLMFLTATMCFRTLFTADRYILEHFAGADMLGAYVLYCGMAMAIVNFMDPAIFSFLYPRLVSAWRQGHYVTYRRVLKELTISAVLASFCLAAACALLAPWVLRWTGRDIYLAQQPLLWVLLAVAVLYGIGMVPHYGLYARGADRSIMFAHISSLVVFVVLVALMITYSSLYAVPLALIGAFLWMGGVKLWIYARLEPNACDAVATPEHC